MVKRQFESSSKVISNIKQLNSQDHSQMNSYQGQRHKPKVRSKVGRMETDREYYDLEEQAFRDIVDAFLMDFMGNVFNVLMESISDRLTIDSRTSITDSDRTMFMFLYAFGMKCNRLAALREKKELEIGSIINCLQLSMFTQIYQQVHL